MSKTISMLFLVMSILAMVACGLGGCGDDGEGGGGDTDTDSDSDTDTDTDADVVPQCVDGDNDTYGANCDPGPDCDDENADVHEVVEAYLDYDLDGYGAGDAILLCVGDPVPEGYVSDNTDCDDSDGDLYQLLSGFPTEDKDTDGHVVGTAAAADICSGAALPPGYAAAEDDCHKIDFDTGQVLDTYHPPTANKDWGYVGIDGDLLIGSSQMEGASRLAVDYYNGGAAGYQIAHYNNQPTVVSEGIFCRNRTTGALLWTYDSSDGLGGNPGDRGPPHGR